MYCLAGNNFQFNEILKIENFYQCVFKLTHTANINIAAGVMPLAVEELEEKSNISAYIAVKNVDNFLIPEHFVLQHKNFPGSTTGTSVSWNRMCTNWSLFFILF